MKEQMKYQKPMEIENRSMEIIQAELGETSLPEPELCVLRRVIHTTADFDYAKNLVFSPHAVERALDALRNGAHIVTDTNMALAGINKTSLHHLGGEAHCFMADPDVAAEAKARGVTRAVVSMEHACRLDVPLIFAVGNAPTALVRLDQLIEEKQIKPELIIGVPVGFVNVVEAKEQILAQQEVPCIVARGRKGGSNVAAAVCNALLYQLYR
ncbi:precorrin-8X methylmutase [uncultured Ruminococcus sp.]|uniref:precorrin-8X methylmutase n=1 Tax=Ruminococcus sp. TaxID=41978 RepID=UPI00266553A3|nr:precorrin-8X methylmutase [uncultured Ruminococcus sp.]